MYKFIAAVSVLIRQFLLPNPFENLSKPIMVSLSGIPIQVPPFFINAFIAEPILNTLTYTVVGIYYTRKVDHPAKGSFLYALFYCIHVAMLVVMAKFQFAVFAIVLTILIYVICQVSIVSMIHKVSNYF